MKLQKNYILLLTSAVGIVLVSLFSSKVIPLYDGVGFPDEPYRYVSQPKDATVKSTLSPSPGEMNIDFINGSNPTNFSVASQEQGPQVNIFVQRLAIKSSANNTKANFKVVPLAPSGKTPKGDIAGNIYRFSGSTSNGTISFKPNTEVRGYVYLRLPQGFPAGATVIYKSSSMDKWKPLSTTQSGSDVYQTKINGFGYYALVSVKTNPNNPVSIYFLGYVFAIILVIIIVILLVIRLRQNKKSKGKKKTD